MTANTTLDGIRPSGLKKTYCKCGRIVGLDRNAVALKRRLNKSPECPTCRNARISADIDEIDSLFRTSEEDPTCC